jgi:hypothetical protein
MIIWKEGNSFCGSNAHLYIPVGNGAPRGQAQGDCT